MQGCNFQAKTIVGSLPYATRRHVSRGAWRMAPRTLVALCCVLGLIALADSAPIARADGLPTVDLTSDPWFVNWSEVLPPAYLGTDKASSDVCVSGQLSCVDRTAQRLERQLSNLGCNHNAIFTLAYTRTTEMVAQVERKDPTFFGTY